MRVTESVKAEIYDPLTGEKVKRAIAIKVNCLITKNKCAPPYRDANMYIWFGKGIYETPALLEIGSAANIIIKNGSIYKLSPELTGEEEWQNFGGGGKCMDYLDAHPETYARLMAKVLEYVDSFDQPVPEAGTQVETRGEDADDGSEVAGSEAEAT